jgi:O-antigen ligase
MCPARSYREAEQRFSARHWVESIRFSSIEGELCVKVATVSIHELKNLLTRLQGLLYNPYPLLITLFSFSFIFFLGRGHYRVFLDSTLLLVLAHLFIRRYFISCIRSPHFVVVVITSILLVVNYLTPGTRIDERSVWNIFYFIGIVLGIHFLSLHLQYHGLRLLGNITVTLLAVLTLAHLFGDLLFPLDCENQKIDGRHCGLFSNPHFLAMFASLAIPLLVYFAKFSQGQFRVLTLTLLFGNSYLLLITGSRSAWLALLAGNLSAIILFARANRRWWSILGVCVLAAIVYFEGIEGANLRVDKLIKHFSDEDRLIIWADSWRMLLNNSLPEWLLGHGIDSFGYYFGKYSHLKVTKGFVVGDFTFPHNFLMELLFDNGITGLILIIVGYVAYFLTIIRYHNICKVDSTRFLIAVFFTLSIIHLIHTFLTLPFYAKPAILPLGLIMGVSLAVGEHWVDEHANS